MRNNHLKHLLWILIILCAGLAKQLWAIDKLEIDFPRDQTHLPFDLFELRSIGLNPGSPPVDIPLMLWRGARSPFGEEFIIQAFNPDRSRNEPASLCYTTPRFNRALDQDPINFEIKSVGLYTDSAFHDQAIVLGCFRNDSAFAVRVIPGSDSYQAIYLCSGADRTGNKTWDAAVNVLLCEDYDYDGIEEVFIQVYAARDLYPRTLYCLEMERGQIEWELPVAGAILRNAIYSCRNTLNPAIIFTTYNVKNGASDHNFTDLFCQIAIVAARGRVLFNRIVSEEHGGAAIHPSESDTIYYVTHSLPFVNPADSLRLPPKNYRLSRISRSGQILSGVDIAERIESMWLDTYRAGIRHLYTISITGRVRIYDPRLNLWAESNETSFSRFLGITNMPNEKTPAYVIRAGSGCAIYSGNFKKLAGLIFPAEGFIALNRNTPDGLDQIIFYSHNSFALYQIQRKEIPEYSKIIFWEYQKYIILALLILLIALLITYLLRMRTIRQLRISQSNLDQLFKSNPEAAVYTDVDGLIIDINPLFRELFGYEQAEVQGKSIFTLLVPEHQTEEIASRYRNMDGPLIYEAVRKRKDGTLIHVRVSGAEFRVENRRIGYIILYEDITEIRRARENLKENAARYRMLFEDAPILLAEEDYSSVMPFVRELISSGAYDLEKHLLQHLEDLAHCESLIKMVNVNKFALKTYGADTLEELKNHFRSIPSADSARALAHTLATFAAGGKNLEFEISSRTITGEKLHAFIKIAIAPGYEESFSKVFVSLVNITRRKLAEDELRHSEEKYRLLVQNAGAVIVLFDSAGKVLFINDDALKSSGLEKNNGNELTLRSFLSKEEADRHLAKIREVILTGKESLGERSATVKGSLRWFTSNLQPYHDKDGKIVGALVIAHDITDRIIAEEKVRESEARLRAIINSIDDLIFVIDAQGKFKYFEQAERGDQLYQEPDKFIGRHIGEVLPEELSRKAINLLNQIALEGDAKQLDYTLDIKGQTKWFSARLSPLLNAQGKFEGITVVSREITAQVTANLELKNERDFTRSVLETANSLIVCLDSQAKIKIFNDECEKVTGYRRAEVLGKSWPEIFLPPAYRHAELDNFANWVKTNPRDKYEGPILTKTGEVRTILWSNSAIIDPVNGAITAIAIGQDITLRKKVEEAHRRSEQRIKTQFRSFPIPSYTWRWEDNDFVMVDYNDAALQITNGNIAKARGIKASQFHKNEEPYWEDLKSCYEKKVNIVREVEYQYKTIDKKQFLIVTLAYVAPDLVMVFTQDITELKHAKAEKVRQARDIAGGFAHEIRNSLFPAKGALSLLSKYSNGENSPTREAQKYVLITNQSIDRAIDITNQITQYTRMENEYFPESVNIAEVVKNVIDANHLELEKHGIQAGYSGQASLAVRSNSRQLYQVINNLLLNSIDALTKVTDPNILISWEQSDSFVQLNFTDNGEGIPSANLERIFDAFYSTKPDNGTGIGLAIAKKTIEMYDGNITVESLPGKGTTFKLRMKLASPPGQSSLLR